MWQQLPDIVQRYSDSPHGSYKRLQMHHYHVREDVA